MGDAELYRIRKFVIDQNHELYFWCDKITSLANNFANAVRFRQRQVLTAVKKDISAYTDNEREIMEEIETFVKASNGKYKMPTAKNYILSSRFIEELMVRTKNPDYFAKNFPKQSAQQMIKVCCREMKSFFAAIRSYNQDPSKFTGKPKLPRYRRKGGHTTCKLTNQDVVLYQKDDLWSVKLPLITTRLDGGPAMEGYRIKEAEVIPENGKYIISLTLQKVVNLPELVEVPTRIAAGDIGVGNLLSVTNNVGLPFIIYKGGVIKSVNRDYNKKLAEIMSKRTTGTTKKFVPTQESQDVTTYRNLFISDFMHKVGKHFVNWCVENRIDTVVIGVNKGFKQEVNLGDVNNQSFVQIPFLTLRNIIKYLCEENGIRYIEREESYTSKANFLGKDYIPTYGKDDDKAHFTGRRRPASYKSSYRKKDGFRGLYKTNDGIIINSDLNGSANILRKEFPDACETITKESFSKVIIIKHPDYVKAASNRAKQLSAKKSMSNSKIRRLKQKGKLIVSN